MSMRKISIMLQLIVMRLSLMSGKSSEATSIDWKGGNEVEMRKGDIKLKIGLKGGNEVG
jgi:hypothetical protein